jgi:hypothetical protein
MFEQVQIIFSGLEGSEPVRTEVRAWLTKVAPLTGEAGITGGHVLIEATYQHHHGAGWRYQASLELATSMNNATVVGSDCAGNNPSDDIYVAVRNVFRCARRALAALQEQRDIAPPPRSATLGVPSSSPPTALPVEISPAMAADVERHG